MACKRLIAGSRYVSWFLRNKFYKFLKKDPLEMTTKIGILSDTHLIRPEEQFRKQANRCFADVDMIFHAGDLTDISVLDVFKDKELHVVHGNMCNPSCRRVLPTRKIIQVGNFSIGLIHGMNCRYDVENCLMGEFEQVDCIISGHTHVPLCRQFCGILFINPGSFLGTGRYGAPGTYAILDVADELKGSIFEV